MKFSPTAISKEPLVSVGIPTYNQPDGLRRTLECIVGQTYRNIEIIVSDNDSPDPRVASVGAEFRERDARVRYFRQLRNVGPTENFRFVLGKASGKYFMWAADDDFWETEFIEKLAELLEKDKQAGVAFCSFDARYTDGGRVERYPEFLPLLQVYSNRPIFERLATYISQEESFGKANLIYGLYCKHVLIKAGGMKVWGLGWWGADMLIVCSVLARGNFVVSEKLLYHVGAGPRPSVDQESPLSPLSRDTRASRTLRDFFQHAGYVFGYARIVTGASELSVGERFALLKIIARKLATFLCQDVAINLRCLRCIAK